MTQAAAFRATYSDFKLIKTRGVVSISFEVPLEQVDLAYQVLGGMPDASAERWFAVAKLGGEPAHSLPPVEAAGPCGESPDRPHKPRKPVAADKRLAQQAGMACSNPQFWRFLSEHDYTRRDFANYSDEQNEIEVAGFVRDYCGVDSRSEIVLGTQAAEKWMALESQFTAWRFE